MTNYANLIKPVCGFLSFSTVSYRNTLAYMDLIQPVARLSWPVLEGLLSDSEEIFQSSCQSLTYPFPFFRKVKENQKKDPFCTKTRLTRYLCNLISQNCTNKSQKWLHEIIQLLKIFKILAVSLCQR